MCATAIPGDRYKGNVTGVKSKPIGRDGGVDMSKIAIVAVCLHILLADVALGQKDLVPESITPLELWNTATWYYPFGIAAGDAWTDYLKNAQHASNQLYKQVEKALTSLSFLNALANAGKKPEQQDESSSTTAPAQTTLPPPHPSTTTKI